MTLWTPDGEHPIDRVSSTDTASATAGDPGAAPSELSPEQEEQAREMARQMSEARTQLLETEVSTVIANHALGLYELAAIHITAEDPDLVEARLAVDAMAGLVDGLRGRLGEVEANLDEALHQIKLAFVQRVQAQKQATTDGAAVEGDTETET